MTPQNQARIRRGQLVSNEPLRERAKQLLDRGDSWYAIAGRLGWSRTRCDRPGRYPAATEVRRALGEARNSDGRYTSHLSYDRAVSIALALDMDPVDAGL